MSEEKRFPYIKNKVIDAPLNVILKTIRRELGNTKLRDIEEEVRNNIAITCPIHKEGRERNPSCNVYTKKDDSQTEYGKVHCFTCGYTASFPEFVGHCFNEDEDFGQEWLIERFGTSFFENVQFLPEIKLEKKVSRETIDPSILNNFNFYHPYMWKRKLSKEVVDRFQIGFDEKHNCITFPVWDEKNNLVMITSRSVENKSFYIEEEKVKPVYLLNFVLQDNIKSVYVCESQINALTLWSWGYPAVALFGTGTPQQYDILNKCGVRSYILCFDGDEAGDKGQRRFINNIRRDVIVSCKRIPRGRDVNDLTKEEFDMLDESV